MHAIDAEFGSDALNNTITEPVDIPKPYLTGVADPISSTVDSSGNTLPGACHATPNGNIDVEGYEGLLMGMSQRGAIRWASGNQCLPHLSGGASVPWPVDMPSPIKWDYRQILAHYYTGVEFKNDDTGAYFAPNDRWNLLEYEGIPNTMTPGQQITPTLIWLQNTSTQPWNNAVLGYRWTGANGADTGWVETSTALSTAAGDDETLTNVVITAPNDGVSYDKLHFDVKVLEFRVQSALTKMELADKVFV
jgi:hypothetical protein